LNLTAAIGRYPHTEGLLSGALTHPGLHLNFADMPVISRAFAPMVRAARFDVSEMAIGTFLQARAYGKPLVLLPVVMAARFQQSALLCRADGPVAGPADLAGRRVGVRAYSQTTGLWLRGILADEYGVRPEAVQWVTFEDAHVPEYQDPAWAERAPPGADLLAMLRGGDIDAAIFGAETPSDPALRTVFPDPAAAADAFWRRHHLVPINHMVCIRRSLAEAEPGLVAQFVPLLQQGPFPTTRAALEPAIGLALRYMHEQGMLPRPLRLDEVWDGLPPGIGESP